MRLRAIGALVGAPHLGEVPPPHPVSLMKLAHAPRRAATGSRADRRRPPMTVDFRRLERLRSLARLMDARWRLPGVRVRIGLDGLASLAPVVGDTLTAFVSLWIVYEATRFDVPKSLILRMLLNVGIDWLFGSVPVIGTIFDVAFKANRLNVNLLHAHLEERLGGRPPDP
jgi:hypothetical protein